MLTEFQNTYLTSFFKLHLLTISTNIIFISVYYFKLKHMCFLHKIFFIIILKFYCNNLLSQNIFYLITKLIYSFEKYLNSLIEYSCSICNTFYRFYLSIEVFIIQYLTKSKVHYLFRTQISP